jgi:arylsulfatase
MKITTTLSITFLLGTSCLAAANAQTITGTPGSPSATTTIDGKQLPPPPPKFGG